MDAIYKIGFIFTTPVKSVVEFLELTEEELNIYILYDYGGTLLLFVALWWITE